MFGMAVKRLYEAFHQGNRYEVNMSAVVDDNPSETLGKIAVDLFEHETCTPICSFAMKLNISQIEGNNRTVRRCILEQLDLNRDVEMQELLTIMTLVRNATTGIMSKQDNVLFDFERQLTSAGGYMLGLGVTDIVYSDDFQAYLRRPNGALLQVEVQSAENAHRTYSIDILSYRNDKFDVTNTFSGNYIMKIVNMATAGNLTTDEKRVAEELGKKYSDASSKLDEAIMKVIVPYYRNNIAKWGNRVLLK